ncbi:MAG: DUF3772 domain-containing protein, partial [Pseudomonadota bacterium]
MAAPFDQDAFARLETRAQEVIARGEASTPAFEALRQQLTAARTAAATRRDAARTLSRPISDRLAALGPAPGDGETEAEDVATLRSQLTEQLATARSPVLAAEDIFTRADNLVKQIDATLRDRQTNALLTLDPTPLNPARWWQAGGALLEYANAIRAEVLANWRSTTLSTTRLSNAPVAAIMVGAALLLLFRARRWSRVAQAALSQGAKARLAALYGFLGALGQIALPALGLYLLVQAIHLMDLVSLRGVFLLNAIGVAGFALFFATWVARLLFVPTDKFPALIEVEDGERRRLRNAFLLLGLMFALLRVLLAMGEGVTEAAPILDATTTLIFPLVVLGGVALFRIGRLLRAKAALAARSEVSNPFLSRVAVLMGTFCAMAGFVGPVASAVGYTQAGTTIVFSTALSLLLIAGFYILFRLIGMMTGFIGPTVVAAGAEDETQRFGALFQVSLGFFFICAAVPLLALIWGIRLSELQ